MNPNSHYRQLAAVIAAILVLGATTYYENRTPNPLEDMTDAVLVRYQN